MKQSSFTGGGNVPIGKSALHKRCVIHSVDPSDEINGSEVVVEGFYGMANDMAIIRFDEPLSNGYQSLVLSTYCLKEI